MTVKSLQSGSCAPIVAALACMVCASALERPAAAEPAPRVDRSGRPQAGVASIYGSGFTGAKTASGTRFSPHEMTVASPTLPLGTKAKVVNAETGKTADVTVTDRGPFAKRRVLDVSPKVARKLGIATAAGVAPVAIQPVKEPAPVAHSR